LQHSKEGNNIAVVFFFLFIFLQCSKEDNDNVAIVTFFPLFCWNAVKKVTAALFSLFFFSL